MPNAPRISIIAALTTKGRGVGYRNKLLFHIPDDLKRFKALTLGHPVILGRKTHESIVGYLGKPLPGRTSIVVTRQHNYPATDGIVVAHSLEEAFLSSIELESKKPEGECEIFVGGGPDLWAQAMPHVDRLYLTLVDAEPPFDATFPDYSAFTKEAYKEKRVHDDLHYTWLNLERA